MVVTFIYLIIILWESVKHQPLSPNLRRTRLPGHKLNMLTNSRRPTCDPCLRGCFCAAEPHRHPRYNFLPLLPPLPPINGAIPTLSTRTPLPTALWVQERCRRREMNTWGGRDKSASPLTDYLLLFCPWMRRKRRLWHMVRLFSSQKCYWCNSTEKRSLKLKLYIV